MQTDSNAAIIAAAFSFAATCITQYFLARRDRMNFRLEMRREQDERYLRLLALMQEQKPTRSGRRRPRKITTTPAS